MELDTVNRGYSFKSPLVNATYMILVKNNKVKFDPSITTSMLLMLIR